MENHSAELDRLFLALADPTRRAVVGRLGAGPQSISTLAEPFAMALPSFLKHIRLLEEVGLIETRKAGRVRTCALRPERLDAVAGWLETQKALWEGRTDRLERFVILDMETNHD